MSDRIQCDDCGKSTIFDDDASYRCKACSSQAYRDHHELYLAARADGARQARTIRRLFTAYFLAKGQLKNVNACLAYALERHARLQADVHENVIPESVQAGVDLERARIVTALRDLDLISEYGAVPSLLADAIERGEL